MPILENSARNSFRTVTIKQIVKIDYKNEELKNIHIKKNVIFKFCYRLIKFTYFLCSVKTNERATNPQTGYISYTSTAANVDRCTDECEYHVCCYSCTNGNGGVPKNVDHFIFQFVSNSFDDFL